MYLSIALNQYHVLAFKDREVCVPGCLYRLSLYVLLAEDAAAVQEHLRRPDGDEDLAH